MSVGHDHALGWFDAGQCQACAHEAGLLDHYGGVQRDEARLRRAHRVGVGGPPVGRLGAAGRRCRGAAGRVSLLSR